MLKILIFIILITSYIYLLYSDVISDMAFRKCLKKCKSSKSYCRLSMIDTKKSKSKSNTPNQISIPTIDNWNLYLRTRFIKINVKCYSHNKNDSQLPCICYFSSLFIFIILCYSIAGGALGMLIVFDIFYKND